MKCLMFSGHGSIFACGGNGKGSGGGGAGGRVAVHISWLREFSGILNCLCVPIINVTMRSRFKFYQKKEEKGN